LPAFVSRTKLAVSVKSAAMVGIAIFASSTSRNARGLAIQMLERTRDPLIARNQPLVSRHDTST